MEMPGSHVKAENARQHHDPSSLPDDEGNQAKPERYLEDVKVRALRGALR